MSYATSFSQKLTNLIVRLTQQTNAGTLRWKKTTDDENSDIWDCNLSNSTARVFSKDYDGAYPYCFYLFSEDGTLSLKLNTAEEGFGVDSNKVKELYDSVIRRGSGVEELVDEMLEELDRLDPPF